MGNCCLEGRPYALGRVSGKGNISWTMCNEIHIRSARAFANQRTVQPQDGTLHASTNESRRYIQEAT